MPGWARDQSDQNFRRTSLSSINSRYPCTCELGGESIELSLLTGTQQDEMLSFANSLPEHDLLFLSRDIQEPKVLDAWLQSIKSGEIVSVVARRSGQVVGTTAVVIDKYSWSPHVGELRVLVSPTARQIGLGRKLIEESFLIGLELGLEKLTARMTLDQDGAIAVFEEMGFSTEAHFKDHVQNREGKKHDLLILSHDVARLGAQLEAYGMDEAF